MCNLEDKSKIKIKVNNNVEIEKYLRTLSKNLAVFPGDEFQIPKLRQCLTIRIMGIEKGEEHPYTSPARIVEDKLIYSKE